MKSFEELINDSGSEDLDQAKARAQSLLNGCRIAENIHRKELNKLSFGLNRKVLEGCQGEELLRFYNESVGSILDDFIF